MCCEPRPGKKARGWRPGEGVGKRLENERTEAGGKAERSAGIPL